MTKQADRIFLGLVLVTLISGIFIFFSASFGLLTRVNESFWKVAFSQLILGLTLGIVALIVTYNIDYRLWKKYSLVIFILALGVTLLVFVPGLGVKSGGAYRWISILGLSFQPAEFLKLAFIIYLASWLSSVRDNIKTFRYGILPLMIIVVAVAGVLLAQPNTSTLLIILCATLALLITAGGRWTHLGLIMLVGLILLIAVAYFRPYVANRISTFFNPSSDPLGSSYQVRQSLIAIGSGGLFGRGFGQSIQKFNYLPEPVGDSIFAVAAEEFGFLGSVVIVLLFLFFALRGFRIANSSPDSFSRFLVIGIVILIVAQSYLNIAAMIGLLPLTGVPLLFISHGGTALLFTLAEVGIILNISKYHHA